MQRDFTYIDDIISGTISAIDHAYEDEIFNLGHNKPHTVLELVETLEAALGKKAAVKHYPMQPGEVPVTYADIDKAKERLNFHPTVSLKEGISHFASWYKDFS